MSDDAGIFKTPDAPAPPSTEPLEPERFVEIDKRLENVERVVDVIKHVSNRAVESWEKYLSEKATAAEKAQQMEDRQHSRATFILCYSVTLVGILCMLALWKEQYELVKLILSSSLALAAGAGVTSVWRRSRKPGE